MNVKNYQMKSKRGTGTSKLFEITSVCKDDILGLET